MFNKPNSYYQNRNTYLQERRYNQQVRIDRILFGAKLFWNSPKTIGLDKKVLNCPSII